jgi:ribose transport system permease protein
MNSIKVLYKNKSIIALYIATGLIAAGGILAPGFASFSNIMNILSLSSFLGVVALGETIVIISGGDGLDLTAASVISLSAVMASQIMGGENANIPLAVLAVLGITFIIGLANGLAISHLRIPPLIMTLAMSTVVQGMVMIYTQGQPKGSAAPLLSDLGNARLGDTIPYIVIVWIIVIVIAELVLRKTRWGRLLYGVGANSLAAELSGVRTKRIRTSAYVASAMICGFAGILILGYTGTSYLDIGSTYLMPAIAAVVIGGVSLAGGSGNYLGTVTGVIVLIALNSMLATLKMGEAGRQIVYGSILVALLIAYARNKKTK